jgi:hypothetical protein
MLQPAINDSEYDLIWKFSHNMWEAAGGEASGVTEPDIGHDDQFTILKKAVAASALL